MSSSLATWHFFSNNMANIIWILLEATKLMVLVWDFERTLDMSGVQTAAPTFMLPGCPQTGYEFEFKNLMSTSSWSALACVMLPTISLTQGS